MSDLLPWITAVAILLGMAVNLVGAVSAWRARAEAKAARIAAEQSKDGLAVVGGNVYNLGKAVDGRLSELLASTEKMARAEGHAAGEQSQRDRQSPPEA